MNIVKTHKDTVLLIGGISAIVTGFLAVLTYINTKEYRKLQKTNAQIDEELKLLELELKKTQLRKTNSYS